MKIINLISAIVAIILYGCDKSHETSRILGEWIGHQVYEFEQTIISDSAQTLEEILGEVVQTTEIVQDSIVFQFGEDSVWIKNGELEAALWLIPDEENTKDFLLVGGPTLSLTISKFAGDSLVIDEKEAPITFSFQRNGQLGVSNKKIIKSSFVLTRITGQQNL